MEGVTRFQFSNEQLQAMIYAQTATYQENGRWLLEGVKQTFVSKDSVRSTEADSLYWDTEEI